MGREEYILAPDRMRGLWRGVGSEDPRPCTEMILEGLFRMDAEEYFEGEEVDEGEEDVAPPTADELRTKSASCTDPRVMAGRST
jgi:hypothetical protein